MLESPKFKWRNLEREWMFKTWSSYWAARDILNFRPIMGLVRDQGDTDYPITSKHDNLPSWSYR
ncbi:unnamed protein product [Prunus armeniaca]